jgi:hypothetical protein
MGPGSVSSCLCGVARCQVAVCAGVARCRLAVCTGVARCQLAVGTGVVRCSQVNLLAALMVLSIALLRQKAAIVKSVQASEAASLLAGDQRLPGVQWAVCWRMCVASSVTTRVLAPLGGNLGYHMCAGSFGWQSCVPCVFSNVHVAAIFLHH